MFFKVFLLPILFAFIPCQGKGRDQGQIESNFARDVMMPIGIPFLSSYHAMRESLFFNTKIKGGTFLESTGNFFLTPSRYLFDGKTIKIQNLTHCDYESYPSFHYEKMHWLKTLGAIVAFPVGETLGATFKGLAHLFPKTRKRYQRVKKAIYTPLVRANLEKYRNLGIETFHCEEMIPCQSHPRPDKLLKRQELEIKSLQEIASLLEAHNILWWVDCGTCLGAYRHGGIIPWDWDIDIAILLPDHENVKKVLSQLDPKRYQIQDWSSYTYPRTFLKLYLKETQNFIDIYHYAINPEEKTLAYFFTFKDSPFPQSWKEGELRCTKPVDYSDVFPLKRGNFDGISIWAPNQVEKFLQSKYGENLNPAKVWDEESKTYKKVANHPYNCQ